MKTENEQIVLDFLEAVKSRDIDTIMPFFSEDCIYHNIPLEPVSGTEAIKTILQPMCDFSSEVNWKVHDIAQSTTGNVLTERTDCFIMDGKRVEVPVMGIFELKNGKISAWRDYFDANQVGEQLPASFADGWNNQSQK